MRRLSFGGVLDRVRPIGKLELEDELCLLLPSDLSTLGCHDFLPFPFALVLYFSGTGLKAALSDDRRRDP